MEAIKFKNFSAHDFTWNFDGVPYNFPADSEVYLEDFKAHHFAKHLVDRELNRLNIPTNDPAQRAEFESKCFPVAETVTSEQAVNIEAKKKETKKTKKVAEEEFAELEETPVEEEVTDTE